ncbi:uncharacterized protein (TIGR00297 family) [Paenibacillus phyllosphaerae]|uniref:Uncharacterized protein (TIGR00297 family) n=1 Tax=Paenibacillus phyllosphaerae TaxID=274593 RepID=A0A7W5AT03_9BACL|nr:DUF92 domain-containing protein [Paenibacillus phyllosphaerae]MBB3108240.1 uncharacterized protein (TIGR00297 family) [Paenibacillus phyllosphaerae]
MVGYIEEWWLRILIGLAGSAIIAGLAWKLRSLSGSGAVSAIIMGTGFIALGGPQWFAGLIAFFVSSTLWSKWKKRHRAKQSAEANYAKGGRRDAAQVWANGGLGLLLCAGHAIWPDEGWLFAFAGVMGAVNADTWATEIGALSRSAPRSILTGAVVTPGTSGGVSLLGSAAAAAGASFIGIILVVTGYAGVEQATPWALFAAAAFGGTVGAFADSLIGATVQAMYRCGECGARTERAVHCGKPAKLVQGWSFMTNDMVNLLSSAAAGLLAYGLSILI